MMDLYETQRAMRNMRKAALQRGVIAILDVGTSKIACLVLRFDGPERFRESDGVGSLAGQSSFRVIGAATTRSRGVRFGEIDAMQETERAVRTAVQAAQKMAKVRVDHVIACFSGAGPRSYGLAGEGADRAVPEALALMRAAKPLEGRLRGLVRMGERRWDVVLDRGQRILLPEKNPIDALEQVIAVHQAQELLERDLAAVDMRNVTRPTLRMEPQAVEELRRIRGIVVGDAMR